MIDVVGDMSVWTIVGGAVLLGGLLWLSIIDARTYRLPNLLTFPLIAAGLVYNFMTALDAYPYILGAALGYALFWVIETVYKVVRGRPGLGRGDTKLLAAGGAWCGWFGLPFIVLLGSGAALAWVIAKGEHNNPAFRLPFGPFLAFGIGAVWLAMTLSGYNAP